MLFDVYRVFAAILFASALALPALGGQASPQSYSSYPSLDASGSQAAASDQSLNHFGNSSNSNTMPPATTAQPFPPGQIMGSILRSAPLSRDTKSKHGPRFSFGNPNAQPVAPQPYDSSSNNNDVDNLLVEKTPHINSREGAALNKILGSGSVSRVVGHVCSDAYHRLMTAIMRAQANASRLLSDYKDATKEETNPTLRAAIKTYKFDCFHSPHNLPEAVKSSHFLKWVGVFRFGDNPPQCTGFLISPTVIRTAWHCFRYTDGQGREKPTPFARNMNSIKFYTFASPHVPLSLSNVRKSEVLSSNDEIDVILDRPAIPAKFLPVTRLPKKGDILITAGPFVPDGTGSLVVSYGAGCTVIDVQNGCIVHRCQTTKGFSGAPLVAFGRLSAGSGAITQSVVAVVGIHLGTGNYVGCGDPYGAVNAGRIVIRNRRK